MSAQTTIAPRRTAKGFGWFRGVSRIDLLLAFAAFGVMLVDAFVQGGSSHPLRAVALSILIGAPLLFVRRWPLAVLVTTITVGVLCAATLEATNGAIGAALIPLYGTAVLGWRRRSVVIGTATTALLVVATALLSSHFAPSVAALRLLLLVGAIAAGDIVRSRRALHVEEARRREQETLRQLREQEQRLAEERLRIARDLHDSVGHALVAINVQAGVAAHLGKGDSAEETLLEIKRVSADALGELRATLDLVRTGDDAPTSPPLDLESLPDLLDRTRNAGLEIDTDISLQTTRLPAAAGQAGFRIVQEALTNTLRHAHADHAWLTITVRADRLEILVDDNGGATPTQSPTRGHGLEGMRERVAALGGSLNAGPRDQGGWRVHATLPLPPHAT